MTKAPSNLQDLRRRIYRKAKSEKTHRFWGLFVHVTKIETLEEAYRIAKRNGGAAGIDGQSFSDIETQGLAGFLDGIREDLITGSYKPMPNRRVEIPKGNGKVRTLQIPCIRDRVVQGALKLTNPGSCLRGRLSLKLVWVSAQAVATSRAGGSQAQCDAAYVDHNRCGSVPLFRHDPAFGAVRQDREAHSGPASPAPGKAGYQSWRQYRCSTRGTVQPAGCEHLSERDGLVFRRDSPQDGRRRIRGRELSSVRR